MLDMMREALTQDSAEGLREAAHTLKGSSSNLGAEPITRLCTVLEEQGQAGLLDEAASLIEQLEIEFERVKSTLNTLP